MARNINADLVKDIDALQGRLAARFEAMIDDERAALEASCPGCDSMPREAHRMLLIRGESFFPAMRRLLIERGAGI